MQDSATIISEGKLFTVMGKVSVASFMIHDHVKWLQMHRFVSGDFAKTGIRGQYRPSGV